MDAGRVPASGTVIRGERASGGGEQEVRPRGNNQHLPGAICVCGSTYHITRNIKFYIVLDEILTLF